MTLQPDLNKRNKRGHISISDTKTKRLSALFVLYGYRLLHLSEPLHGAPPDPLLVAMPAPLVFRKGGLPLPEAFGLARVSTVDHLYIQYKRRR